MVDSNYNLYLDSIETTSDLSNDKFKKVQFSKDKFYDELIPHFYDGMDANIAYAVRSDDSSIMFDTFDKQVDDFYIAGCKDITDNKYYSEDFEYFAPLYVSKSDLPKFFIIFRIDGPGLETIDRTNFSSKILNKFKCIKVVDLTRNTDLGQWLHTNIINNSHFPSSGFEMDFRQGLFSNWNGIDFDKGCFTQKSYIFDDVLEYENTFNGLEKFIYDGFQNNKIIYPNILNLSFLFNDQPATPTTLRQWSLNRYSGFYMEDILLSKSVSTYLPSVIVSDAVILPGNILTSTFNKPFSDSTLKLNKIFIEYLGNFYEVKKVSVNIGGFNTIQWKIISNIDLSGKEGLINKNIITIDSNNKITYIDGSSFTIDDWNTADVWLIKIGNNYHNLQLDNGDYYIYSDYGFTINSTTLNYYVNSPNPAYNTTIDMISGNSWTASNVVNTTTTNMPVSFPIYKCVFSDIKYFDDTIIDTQFAKFEYDKEDTVIQTDETKMYLTNLDDKNIPKNKVDYTINNLTVNIPSASHYTANNETFRINNNSLSKLWSKNNEYVKWGFKNSLSSNDYPYLLNNSFIAEDYNKTVNIFASNPNRLERNLDYFYTINSSTVSYNYHSLHIENIENGIISLTYSFDINQYLNLGYDYFTYFFDRKAYFNNSTIINNVTKFSYFNTGDNSVPNISLFRGLKIKCYDVNSVKIIDNQLQNINISNNNTYEDYKFSILLSNNITTIETNIMNLNSISLTVSNNQMQWDIVDSWKHEKEYDLGSIVNYMEILFISVTDSNIIDPNINPANSSAWIHYNNTLFWSPSASYGTYISGSLSTIVYNSGEYYYNNGLSSNTFYNPGLSYSLNDIVLYNNIVWISNTSSNATHPNDTNIWRNSTNALTFWNKIDYSTLGVPNVNWSIITLWDSFRIYIIGDLVIYNNILYYTNTTTTLGITPDSTTDWIQLYSFIPNTTYIYNTTIYNNNAIYLNNRYYICISNSTNSTLDNGINIFINKKYKNILVNIYVNDNTLNNLTNTDRDALYKDLYTNLTALNFSNAINDVNHNYGFTNKLKYIIFDDNSTNIYDFGNINSFKNLTSLIIIDAPDSFKSRIESLQKDSISLTNGQIKASAVLNNGNIPSLSKKNYYNNLHLGNSIETITIDAKIIPNYSGLKNKVYNSLYRHSGYYDPIFLTVELFNKGLTYSRNTIFDTNLNYFGLVKQMVLSKVNRDGNTLKLKNSPNLKSIYPQLDEFGYFTKDMFIFKSNWDNAYFTECSPIINNDTTIIDTPINYVPVSITPKYLS